MSYIYSKADSKRVYVDPEGTISKYQVRCTNQEEFNFKNNGYLMLYLTQNKFILRSFYNPDIFCIKGYGNVYLEIPSAVFEKDSDIPNNCTSKFVFIFAADSVAIWSNSKMSFCIVFKLIVSFILSPT